jgi:nucleoside-diphosphate-sugar epimerase
MKIFVTGSSGFIGSAVVKHLSGRHEIVTYDVIDGQDLLNYEQLTNAMRNCDMIIHLAAIPRPEEGKSFSDYFRINCEGTFNMAKAAQENKIRRFIYASSTTYYGIEKGIPFVKPIRESNPVVTQHVKTENLHCRDCDIAYSTSKVIAEQILANYGMTKKFEVIILRFGPTRSSGENRPFLGMHLKIENAIEAVEAAILVKDRVWYEAFTIVDNLDDADISKAKRILN